MKAASQLESQVFHYLHNKSAIALIGAKNVITGGNTIGPMLSLLRSRDLVFQVVLNVFTSRRTRNYPSNIMKRNRFGIRGAKQALESVALTDLSEDIRCFNFSKGNVDKMEFYSPNYPNNYPKSIKCILRIIAPPGHTVKLDFRDKFHLENSAACSYDWLEVHDGPHGYSPQIGSRYCGGEFPKQMLSSKRYMWLQFTSDESIEYEGFRAVYDFIKLPNQGQNVAEVEKECSFYKTGHSGFVKKSEMDDYFYRNRHEDSVECMWIIETEADKNLYLNFKDFNLYKPNDCDQNFLQIFPDTRSPDKEMAQFCGTTAEPRKSSSNITYIRLFTQRDAYNKTNFVIHFSSFRDMKKEGRCDPKTEFNCGDQTCIDISLKCDGESDCKYRYDEEPTLCATAMGAAMLLTSEHMIVILVVFFSLVVAMCASISISCYNKIRERQVREREYKERRSKEASVEVTLDRSLQRPRDDESSDGGCYVPEVDFRAKQRTNGGDTVPKKPIKSGGSGTAFQQQHYPYISESFESLQSDVIVPPAPPPVPAHMKERREISPPPPTYRIVGGKVVANPAKNEPPEPTPIKTPIWQGLRGTETPLESRPPSSRSGPRGTLEREPLESKTNWLRGPLEAGAPRSAFNRQPGEIGLPKFGMSRVTPGGPMAQSKGPLGDKPVPLSAFRSPYERQTDRLGYPVQRETDLRTEASDSSRAHSVASTLSAPDAVSKR
ncbi:neuropilin and tolloid-like protein 2 [Caerostris darwini]|uniref:Neuropilin and tolloid-like protein 2 n=1 Tax=Caerostris darwini TaxID=1538125 RepID=A0AAV4MFD4_9ARAC|nr:neuropilin and tolloid-like protein 2 [Caerostris darwini]